MLVRMKAQTAEETFNVVVEKDEDGYYVASVVELPGCHTQAKSLINSTRELGKRSKGTSE